MFWYWFCSYLYWVVLELTLSWVLLGLMAMYVSNYALYLHLCAFSWLAHLDAQSLFHCTWYWIDIRLLSHVECQIKWFRWWHSMEHVTLCFDVSKSRQCLNYLKSLIDELLRSAMVLRWLCTAVPYCLVKVWIFDNSQYIWLSCSKDIVFLR